VLTGKNIVCFASGWDCHPTSKHHVMRALSKRNHVIWVNWHASRTPSVSWADLRDGGAKLLQIRRGPRPASSSITVMTPLQFPLPGSGLARRANAAIVRRSVRKVLATLEPRPVQFWSFAPDVADLVGGFGEELVVYYCVDAFGEFPGYDREQTARAERELIRRSDLVIATSGPLHEAKRALHDNVHLVEHGVDHEHLSRAVADDVQIPADLRALPRPILGFVGVIGEWADLDIVAGLARRMPDASVVMIGPELTPRGPCAGLPNVHYLGARDHSRLPEYLAGFDVGLIPFRQVPLTYNANPIKLYEYLAAGVPVVSASLPTVRPVPGSVWLADDAETTARACAAALQHNTPAGRRTRSRSTMPESWRSRLDVIESLVDGTLKPRPIRLPEPQEPANAPCTAVQSA
jgi:glycosyltransferase involved in cell wall biosynthesis